MFLFLDLKIEVTLTNFSFSGKTLNFIESPKILIRDFLIWLYIWFVTCSKPGALFIFNDLNAFKTSSSIKGFSSSFVFALLIQGSNFVSLIVIFDPRFGPIFTKKLLNELAIVFVSVISTLSISNVWGKNHIYLHFLQ